MNVEALNRLFEAPAPESSIRKARNADASEPEPDEGASAIHLPDGISAGTLINDKYRIERTLGEGAMGLVFAATHLGLDEAVAIKFMRREVQDIDGTLARFDKEAKIAARIRSEHVTRVLDVGVLPPHGPFIVMEYLEGRTLADMLDTEGPLPVQRMVDYVLQACEGLAAAHAAGVVHRDVKPDNLFVARRGGLEVVKLLDFGISKAPSTSIVGEGEVGTTTASITMGTPLYMSPEQLRSTADVDIRTDIWSLGVALFELACGEPPFQAGSIAEIIAAVLDHAPAELPTSCPAALRAVVARCLEKDPAARFQSVAELAQALTPLASAAAGAHASRASRILNASLAFGAARLDAATVPGIVPAAPAPRARASGSALVAAATVLALGALGVGMSLSRMGDSPRGEPVARPAMGRLEPLSDPPSEPAPRAAQRSEAPMLMPPGDAAGAPPELMSLTETVPDLSGAPASSASSALEQRGFELRPARHSKRLAPKARSHSGSVSHEPVAREAGPKPTRVRLVAARKIRLVEVPAARSHREGLR